MTAKALKRKQTKLIKRIEKIRKKCAKYQALENKLKKSAKSAEGRKKKSLSKKATKAGKRYEKFHKKMVAIESKLVKLKKSK